MEQRQLQNCDEETAQRARESRPTSPTSKSFEFQEICPQIRKKVRG